MTTPIPMVPPVRTWARGACEAITSTREAILKQAQSRMAVFHACICSALCPRIGAKLTLGETDFQSSIFDAFTYTGASLISDERMLPWSLRGYAPQITGIAQTNATVAVSLANRVIYQSKVPPGPFVIQILTSRFRARWTSKVTEEDGRVNTFQVSAESVPFLTRKGQVRYKLAAGKAPRAPPMMLKITPS